MDDGGSTVGTRRGEMLSASTITGIDSFPGHGERVEGEEPLLSHKKVADWAPQQEVMGFDLDTERMTISLLARKVLELRKLLEEWPGGRSTATVREVLVLAGSFTTRRM